MANWNDIQERGQVEDRRGAQIVKVVGGVGVMGIVLVLAVGYFAGPEQAIQLWEGIQENSEQVQSYEEGESIFAGEDEYEVFTSKVLGSTNALWKGAFERSGYEYQEPKIVLFRGATQSACGGAISQVGPHYCSIDQTIYLDETFFEMMQQRFGAKGGDLAQAYVLAHEVGHHVQSLLGLTEKVQQGKMWGGGNEDSIKLELQADCFAGIWVGTINEKGVMDNNDLYEAIDAAEAVGDDSIQEKTAGYVQPETRTHGSSEQRKKRFTKGYMTRSFEACDTFVE